MFKKELLTDTNVMVLCETYKQFKDLTKWAEVNGNTWASGRKFSDNPEMFYNNHFNKTCISLSRGLFTSLDIAIQSQRIITYNEALFNPIIVNDVVLPADFCINILTDDIWINCTTSDQACNLLRWADAHNKCWCNKDSYLMCINWNHREKTVYSIKKGMYGNKDSESIRNEIIVDYHDVLISHINENKSKQYVGPMDIMINLRNF